MNNRKLTWRHLKALNQLFVSKRTEAKILDNGYIKNVLMEQKKLIKYKSDNLKILEANSGYSLFYQQNFEVDYLHYETFLKEQNLETDARKRYTEEDIKILMFIAEYKDELAKNLTTIRTFSGQVFKGLGSKYLENKPSLKNTVCQILNIDDFPEKDPKNLQWRLVVDCTNPNLIVLCENISHLKCSWKARNSNVELWYVGGNNIGIIDYISTEKLSEPIYYSCDWDYHGLSIYSRIKEKLRLKSCNIKLLVPYTYETALSVNSPHHKSRWKSNEVFSGLKETDFSDKARILINRLIKEDKWIEEESLDLLELLKL